MYIEKELYLSLYQKWEETKKENDILVQQNTILANEVEKEKVINLELNEKINTMQEKADALNAQLISQLHTDLKEYMKIYNTQQKQLVEDKFNELEQSAAKKYKDLEMRNKVHMYDTFQQVRFCHKMKKLYLKDCASFDKTEPSYPELRKWVKELINRNRRYQNFQILIPSQPTIAGDIMNQNQDQYLFRKLPQFQDVTNELTNAGIGNAYDPMNVPRKPKGGKPMPKPGSKNNIDGSKRNL